MFQYGMMGLGGLYVLKTMAGALKTKAPVGNNIGLISLNGPILRNAPPSSFGKKANVITPEGVETLVEKALKDNVKGLIFKIGSPGGEVTPSKQISDYMKNINVPTVTLVNGIAASGAYWMASATDAIVADVTDHIGSIGVIMGFHQYSELADKIGVKRHTVTSGKHKDLGNPYRDPTNEELQILQTDVDYIHDLFVTSIAENRKVGKEVIEDIANGLTYLGASAKEKGLIDIIGGKAEAIKIIELAGEFKVNRVIPYEPKGTGLLSRLSGSAAYNLGRHFARGASDSVYEVLAEKQIKIE